MICEECRGRGFIQSSNKATPATEIAKPIQHKPCPECNGNGQQHCCEGLQAQPEVHR